MKTASTALMPFDDGNFTGALRLPPEQAEQTEQAEQVEQAAALHPDWDMLFNAVTARLRDIAGTVATLPGLAGMPEVARSKVLECAEALDQLHAAMAQQQAVQRALYDTLPDTRSHPQPGALHDSLTALPNRDHFRDLLVRALMKTEPALPDPLSLKQLDKQLGNPSDTHVDKHVDNRVNKLPSLALLYLDLDGFKPINDQHGRAVGDNMLRIVAARLARAVRAGDFVGRMGGDEFACLLGGIDDRQQLSHLACKLFDAVSAPLQVGTLQLTLRPSIGIAICPTDGGTADTLLQRADAAMYRAKRAQSGYAFFEPGDDSVG